MADPSMIYLSPLRYPGSKRRLAKFIKLIVAANGLQDGEYIEPYAGGASVALSLLFDGYVLRIHLNDLSRPVYAFWHSVLNETDALCRLIQDTPVTVAEWDRQRAICQNASQHTLLEVGFSAFFLNRTNRSGILSGGIIGGRNQDGDYTLDVRFNKQDLIRRIKRIAQYRTRISVYNQDATEFVTGTLPKLGIDSLVYLDPPYYLKGHKLYDNHYEHSDHARIAKLVTEQISQYWIVSYDNVAAIHDLYAGYERVIYDLHYSAADRYEGSETMFFCRDMVVPDVDDPSRISDRQFRRHLLALKQSQLPLLM